MLASRQELCFVLSMARSVVYVCVSIFFWVLGLLGEEANFVLPDYEVTATQLSQPELRVPFAVSQIDRDEIQTVALQLSLDEPLQTVPGVFMLNPYNYAQDSRIAIRGFGARANFGIRGIQLIADGIPATLPDGQGSVDAIDLGSAERIQILRGPASAIYGASAGGVILLDTESGPPLVPFLESRLTAGSDDLLQAQIKAGGQQEDLNYLMSGTHLDYDGYRDHSQTENRRFNAKFEYALTPNSDLTALVNVIDIPKQNDPGGLTREEAAEDPSQARQRNVDFDSGESVEQTTLGLVYDHRLNDQHSIELKTYYVYRDFENRIPRPDGGQVAFECDFYGLGGLYRFRESEFETVLGFCKNLGIGLLNLTSASTTFSTRTTSPISVSIPSAGAITNQRLSGICMRGSVCVTNSGRKFGVYLRFSLIPSGLGGFCAQLR